MEKVFGGELECAASGVEIGRQAVGAGIGEPRPAEGALAGTVGPAKGGDESPAVAP
jgi:hypothetical protein